MVNRRDPEDHVIRRHGQLDGVEIRDSVLDVLESLALREAGRLSDGFPRDIHSFVVSQQLVLRKAPLELTMAAAERDAAIELSDAS